MSRFCDCGNPDCTMCKISEKYEDEIAELLAKLEALEKQKPVVWVSESDLLELTARIHTGGCDTIIFTRISNFKQLVTSLPLYARPAPALPEGELVVTKNEQGLIVAVTSQDEEGQILSIIAESEMRSAHAIPERWIAVSDRLPEGGVPVLVLSGGKVLRAAHAGKFQLDVEDFGPFNDDGGEYNEADDRIYWPEGWYEWNQYEEIHWQVEKEPTHWMPLPSAPEKECAK